MALKCFNCGSETIEIRECDKCAKMGCHKCLRKRKNEWICLDCEKTKYEEPKQSNLFSMFE